MTQGACERNPGEAGSLRCFCGPHSEDNGLLVARADSNSEHRRAGSDNKVCRVGDGDGVSLSEEADVRDCSRHQPGSYQTSEGDGRNVEVS